MPKIVAMKKRKTVNFQVMLSESEARALRRTVKALGISVSVFLRGLIEKEMERCK